MATDAAIKSLHPLEVKVLLTFKANIIINSTTLVEKLNFNIGQANQALSWLSGKGFIEEISREQKTYYELTELGAEYAAKGTPLERMIQLLKTKGPLSLPDIAGELELENKDVGSAFGQMSKQGVFAMNSDKNAELKDENKATELPAIRKILDRAAGISSEDAVVQLSESELSETEVAILEKIGKKRGASSAMFRIIEREEVGYRIAPAGIEAGEELAKAGITGEELATLTSGMLKDGSWRNRRFRPYNIQVPPSRMYIGRKNPYTEYLDGVRDKLVSLGFEEFDGPLVETEFWNSDALFMPQFHAARDIHDVYYVKNPTHAREIEQPYLDNVAAAHSDGGNTGSRGWNYEFDRDFTRRLILRSQGTVMSAKTLHKATVPGKYFGILRCFRYDQVDATHLSDFYQTEGIVLGDTVSLGTLLGLLKMFATEVAGASEVKYVPGYFPFTEPSVEVHIKHPVLGWFELGGAGIFRPEVTRPMGIDVPVLAWGLGIDRMALMHLGLNDLRELFSADIENVRLRRQK